MYVCVCVGSSLTYQPSEARQPPINSPTSIPIKPYNNNNWSSVNHLMVGKTTTTAATTTRIEGKEKIYSSYLAYLHGLIWLTQPTTPVTVFSHTYTQAIEIHSKACVCVHCGGIRWPTGPGIDRLWRVCLLAVSY